MEEMMQKIPEPEMRSFIQKITDQGILSQIDKVVKFHGYLSTGAFIGIQMFNLAEKVLGESNDDRLFVTCETYNCLPDAFQALAGATIGNKGLNINDHGKMAVTISKRAPVGETIKGVRVVLDPAKTCQYPRLHAWYMKTDKVPHYEVVPILLEAGESVYTYEVLELKVPEKPKKNIVICERCGESFIQNGEEIICKACSVDND